jgi:hypothetical protein
VAKLKLVAFLLVCLGVFVGGIFALPFMASIIGTYGGPTVDFWLLFGGGAAALGLPILLAHEFGYIKGHKTKPWVLHHGAPKRRPAESHSPEG